MLLEDGDQRAVAERGVGAEEHEVIREIGDGHGEVGFDGGGVGPEIRQVDAAFSEEFEAWAVGGVEAGGADDGVDLVVGAVGSDEARGCYVGNVRGDDGDVGLDERFEKVWAGG